MTEERSVPAAAPAGAFELEKVDRARRLRNTRVLTVGCTAVGVGLALVAIVTGAAPVRTLSISGAAAFSLFWTWLAIRGHLTAAAFGIVFTLLVSLPFGLLSGHGLSPPIYFLGLAMLMASATMTVRQIWVVVGGAAVALVVMLLLAPRIPYQPNPQSRHVANGIALAFLSSVVSVIQARSYRQALAAALRQRERATRAETRLELMAENVSDLLALHLDTGECVYATPSFQRVLGVDPLHMDAPKRAEPVHPDDLAPVAVAWQHAVDHGSASVTFRSRRPDGVYLWLDCTLTAVVSEGQRYIILAARDVTEFRALTERLHAAQTMEALGRLAGGVAHDFNNVLSIIRACTHNAQSMLPTDDPIHEELNDIAESVKRGVALTRQLLAFGRREVAPATAVDPGPVVRDMAELLRRILGSPVRLRVTVAPELPPVVAAPVELEQIVMNLAINARDAMPSGGEVHIAVGARELRDGEAGLPAGPYLELSVSDSGVGIPEDMQQQIFQPFFTTKAGRGTGLGLATCYSLATKLGGTIRVRSVSNEGTTFTVLLPAGSSAKAPDASQEGPEPRLLEGSRSDPSPREQLDVEPGPDTLSTLGTSAVQPRQVPSGRVLLVGDDPRAQATLHRVLQEGGYTALQASALEEAAALTLDGIPGNASADVVVGAPSVLPLLRSLRSLRPELPIALLVPQGDSPTRWMGQLEGEVAVVPASADGAALLRALEDFGLRPRPREALQRLRRTAM